MKNPKELYRYTYYADHYDEGEFRDMVIHLDTYEIIKYTNVGYWIIYNNKNKWVEKTVGRKEKRFAYATKKEAMTNLQKRSLMRLSFLRGDILKVKKMLKNSLDSEYSHYEKSFEKQLFEQKY